jgi:hypothetical protein
MNTANKKNRLLKEAEFKILKGLLDYGASPTEVATATGRSNTMLGLISKSATYEDYVDLRTKIWHNSASYKARYPEKFLEEVKPNKTIEVTDDSNAELMELINKVDDVLNILERIENHLNDEVPERVKRLRLFKNDD